MYVYMYVCMYIYIYICVCLCMCVCMCVSMCVCVFVVSFQLGIAFMPLNFTVKPYVTISCSKNNMANTRKQDVCTLIAAVTITSGVTMCGLC
jgi:hypothetical protein